MTLSVSIPSNLQPFVEEELASGKYTSEAELVAAALEVYRELKKRPHQLRENVQRSIAHADRGEVKPLDISAIKLQLRTGHTTP